GLPLIKNCIETRKYTGWFRTYRVKLIVLKFHGLGTRHVSGAGHYPAKSHRMNKPAAEDLGSAIPRFESSHPSDISRCGVISGCVRPADIPADRGRADRSNTQWQRDLSFSYDRVGNVLAGRGMLKAYRDSLGI